MKQRLFLVFLLAVSVGIGGIYFADFIQEHPNFTTRLDGRFWVYIAAAISLQLLGHAFRAYKSRFLLDRVRPSRTSQLYQGLSVGYLFNALLPLRLGEFIRAYVIGDALAISKTTVFMSIVIERVVDGCILAASFLGTAWLIRSDYPPASHVMTRFGLGILIISLVLLMGIHILRTEQPKLLRRLHKTTGWFNDTLSARLRFMGWSGIYGTKLMLGDRKALSRYIVASVVMWECYFASTAAVISAFFHGLQVSQILTIIQSSYAGVSAPAGPGYVGTFHAVVSDILTKLSLGASSSFTLLNWLIIISPISLVGLVVVIRQRFGERKDGEQQAALINKLHRDRDVSPELAHFLDAYLKGDRINQILTQAELDGKFRLIKAFKGGSNASTVLVWQDETLRVKKITLPQYAEKLQEQALWLLQREKLDHLPKVIHEESHDDYYYFDLAFREDYFPFFDYIHSHSAKECFDVLEGVLDFTNTHIYKPKPAKNAPANLKNYIDGKILGKVNDTATMSTDIAQLLEHDSLVINGVQHINLLQAIERLNQRKDIMAELAAYKETPIHGDLTIDNLIVSAEGDYIIVDPNNENQVSAAVVDYGKLYQSLHSGYEFLIQLETCTITGNKIAFEDAKSHKYDELFRSLDMSLKDRLTPTEYRSILFHEAVHYCRMLTYRATINPRTTAVFYAQAVKLFNEFLDQYGKTSRSRS